MDENRRSFLKKAGCTVLGLGCGFPLLGTGCSNVLHDSDEEASSQTQWAMVVDIKKCLKKEERDACVKACRDEHNLPRNPDPKKPEREIKWIWSEEYKHAFPDQTHAGTASDVEDLPVLVMCNHCTNPPCVRVCPTAATWKRKSDGIVMMDMHRCIGCRYCIAACPYGARSFNWKDPRTTYFKSEEPPNPRYPTRTKGVVEKCNLCAERLAEGKMPACVEAVKSSKALVFGDLEDPNSEVRKLLHSHYTIRRKPELGTKPNVYYIV